MFTASFLNILYLELESKLRKHFIGFRTAFCALDIENGFFGNIVVALFALLLLELQRNTIHGTPLQADHKAGCVTNHLVSKTLGCDLSNLTLREDLFVVDKQGAELGIVCFDDLTGCALD